MTSDSVSDKSPFSDEDLEGLLASLSKDTNPVVRRASGSAFHESDSSDSAPVAFSSNFQRNVADELGFSDSSHLSDSGDSSPEREPVQCLDAGRLEQELRSRGNEDSMLDSLTAEKKPRHLSNQPSWSREPRGEFAAKQFVESPREALEVLERERAEILDPTPKLDAPFTSNTEIESPVRVKDRVADIETRCQPDSTVKESIPIEPDEKRVDPEPPPAVSERSEPAQGPLRSSTVEAKTPIESDKHRADPEPPPVAAERSPAEPELPPMPDVPDVRLGQIMDMVDKFLTMETDAELSVSAVQMVHMLRQMLASYQKLYEDSECSANRFQAQLVEKDRWLRAANRKILRLEQEFGTAHEDHERLQKEVARLKESRRSLADAYMEAEVVKSQLQELQADYDEMKAAREEAESQVALLQADAKDVAASLEAAKEENSGLRGALERTEQQLEALRLESGQTVAELAIRQQENQRLVKQFTDAREEIVGLHLQLEARSQPRAPFSAAPKSIMCREELPIKRSSRAEEQEIRKQCEVLQQTCTEWRDALERKTQECNFWRQRAKGHKSTPSVFSEHNFSESPQDKTARMSWLDGEDQSGPPLFVKSLVESVQLECQADQRSKGRMTIMELEPQQEAEFALEELLFLMSRQDLLKARDLLDIEIPKHPPKVIRKLNARFSQILAQQRA